MNDDLAAVAHALDSGASVDARDEHGNTVLWWTCRVGQTSLAELLIARRADVNLANNIEVTPLLLACGNGHVEAARRLLAAPGIDVNRSDKEGAVPLLAASENGHARIVDLLLRQPGLDRDASDAKGKTALQWAQNRGQVNVERLLQADAVGDVAMMRAVMAEVVLLESAQEGNATAVAQQLDAGTHIDAQNDGGETALFCASAAGQTMVTEVLLSRSADVNLASKYGWSPLLIACINGRAEVTSRLLAAPGIDVNQPSKTGGGPLPVATMYGYAPIVELLLRHPGVDRDAKHQGKTALQWAQEKDHAGIVEQLQG